MHSAAAAIRSSRPAARATSSAPPVGRAPSAISIAPTPPPAPAPGSSAVGSRSAARRPSSTATCSGEAPFCGTEHRRRPVRAEQRVAHVERRHELDPLGRAGERLPQALAAVGAGGAAHADDDPGGAGGDGGRDQLPGPERARPERIGRQVGDGLAAARLGDVEGRLAPRQEREAGPARPPERVTHVGAAPLAAAGGEQGLGRALAAVGERRRHDLVAAAGRPSSPGRGPPRPRTPCRCRRACPARSRSARTPRPDRHGLASSPSATHVTSGSPPPRWCSARGRRRSCASTASATGASSSSAARTTSSGSGTRWCTTSGSSSRRRTRRCSTPRAAPPGRAGSPGARST